MDITMIFPLRVGPFNRLMPIAALKRLYKPAPKSSTCTKKGPGRQHRQAKPVGVWA